MNPNNMLKLAELIFVCVTGKKLVEESFFSYFFLIVVLLVLISSLYSDFLVPSVP